MKIAGILKNYMRTGTASSAMVFNLNTGRAE